MARNDENDNDLLFVLLFLILLDGGADDPKTHELLTYLEPEFENTARRAGARPNPDLIDDPWNRNAKKQRVDPISEGWMDSLVPQVLARRCTDFETPSATRR